MKFKVIHITPGENWLLEPIGHATAIGKKTPLVVEGKRNGFIFDTIARVEKPFYLAKLQGKHLEGKIAEALTK